MFRYEVMSKESYEKNKHDFRNLRKAKIVDHRIEFKITFQL